MGSLCASVLARRGQGQEGCRSSRCGALVLGAGVLDGHGGMLVERQCSSGWASVKSVLVSELVSPLRDRCARWPASHAVGAGGRRGGRARGADRGF